MMLLCYLLGVNPSQQPPPALSATAYPLPTPNHRLGLAGLSCLSASDVKVLLCILLCGISGTCTLSQHRNAFTGGGTSEHQTLLQ